MSDKSDNAIYLRLNKRDACALIEWFWFQEQNNVTEGEKSSITSKDLKLLRDIIKCVLQMKREPNKYVAMRLSPDHCRVAYGWFQNLPETLVDSRDADVHAALGMFLNALD